MITPSSPEFVVPPEFFRRTAHQISEVEHVGLGAGDVGILGLEIDEVLAAISHYVVGEIRLPTPVRQVVKTTGDGILALLPSVWCRLVSARIDQFVGWNVG